MDRRPAPVRRHAAIAYTFESYLAPVGDPLAYQALFHTGIFALATIAAGLAFGLAIAWLTERPTLPGKSLSSRA